MRGRRAKLKLISIVNYINFFSYFLSLSLSFSLHHIYILPFYIIYNYFVCFFLLFLLFASTMKNNDEKCYSLELTLYMWICICCCCFFALKGEAESEYKKTRNNVCIVCSLYDQQIEYIVKVRTVQHYNNK